MVTPAIPADMVWLRYTAFIGLYAVWVIGYTFQTSVTRSGQTVLTNDPKQRPMFTIFNTIGSMAGMGLMQFLAPIVRSNVADCSDYETFRSGKYIPGIMGTLFSLVDKLVSSLSATVVGVAVSFIGLENLPTAETPYAPGMNWVVIVLFCLIPMIAWALTLWAMKGYELSGPRMKEIQEINAQRKAAIAKGLTMEAAMKKYADVKDLEPEFRIK